MFVDKSSNESYTYIYMLYINMYMFIYFAKPDPCGEASIMSFLGNLNNPWQYVGKQRRPSMRTSYRESKHKIAGKHKYKPSV